MVPQIEWGIENYISLIGIGFGLICSAYLFYVWLKHKRIQPYVFLWSIGLVLFYIFFIPFIPVNFGENIVLSEWRSFFSSTIPLIFLGWAFVLWGILQAKSRKQYLSPPPFLVMWVVSSFIFYAFRFAPTQYEKVLSIIGIVIFFLAIHICILIALWMWLKDGQERDHAQIKVGVLVIALAVVFSIVRYLMILSGLIKLPQEFWFLTIADFDIGFILRSVVIIVLTFGFLMVHKHYIPKSGV